MDEMVLTVETWLNDTYDGRNGFIPAEVEGIAGTKLFKSLISALQIEIGIASPTGTFGPATLAACPTLECRSEAESTKPMTNLEKVLQGALWCKGYNPGGFTGIFYTKTKGAITSFQHDASFPMEDGKAYPVIMKALFNTDAYILIAQGDPQVRTIQQRLNNRYWETFYTDIGLIPTSGVYDRATCKALIYGLQVEENITSPTGTFGPATLAACPTLDIGSMKTNFVKLLQYALYSNGFNPGSLDGSYTSQMKQVVKQFQQFCVLGRADGVAEKTTWASLLTSKGDINRDCTACDTATTLVSENAASITRYGYGTVGRYIVGKYKMTKDEVARILYSCNLKLFPIFQRSGEGLVDGIEGHYPHLFAGYFTAQQAVKDAEMAGKAAHDLGIPFGTTIYFAVDFDAYDYEVKDNILPYFSALKEAMVTNTIFHYGVGIYGSRNMCIQAEKQNYTVGSFVSDMSTGFSGNLGYPLPQNWDYDQIAGETFGSGSARIEVDKVGERKRTMDAVVTLSDLNPSYQDFDDTAEKYENQPWPNYHATIRINRSNQKLQVYREVFQNDIGYLCGSGKIGEILPNEFYSLRASGDRGGLDTNGNWFLTPDQEIIRSNSVPVNRITFQDPNGNLREGYVFCENNVGEALPEWNYQDDFILWHSNDDGSDLVATPNTVIKSNSYKVFRVRRKTPYVDLSGNVIGFLQPGDEIGMALRNRTVTGESYHWLIKVDIVKKLGSSIWNSLCPNSQFGYVNLQYENGAMPNNRTLY